MAGRKKKFVISYEVLWLELIDMAFFTDREERILNRLKYHLAYTNVVANSAGPMSVADMAIAVRMDESNFRKVLKMLMRKNAIGCWDSGGRKMYYVNPELYCKGERKLWLERQFAHKAHEDVVEHRAKILMFGKNQTTLTHPNE